MDLLTFGLLAVLSVETQFAMQMLTDASFRGDINGMAIARHRLVESEPKEAAHAHYLVAFSEWMESQSGGTEVAQRAMKDVEKAIALDPKLVSAHVLRNRIAFILIGQGALKRDEGFKLMSETFETAKKLAPDEPLVRVVEATFLYYGKDQDHEGGRKLVRGAIDELTKRAATDADAAMWLPVVWNWYGIMFLGENNMDQAESAFHEALKVRPDYAAVRDSMLPMTAYVDLGKAPQFSSAAGWNELLSDAAGDGRIPQLPDLRSVAWRVDQDRVWFRFNLAEAADPSKIGVNLALDTDGNQETGRNWWAGNTAFRYDRLVTVWIARSADGRYRGSIGVADANDAATGHYITSSPGAVAFAFDDADKAVLLGVNRKALGAEKTMHVVATVGSNTMWNDTAPAEGSALLTLDR